MTNEVLPVMWEGWDELVEPLIFEEWPIARVTRGRDCPKSSLKSTQSRYRTRVLGKL